MRALYTFGYWGRSVDQLAQWVQDLDAVLVDVRLIPYSEWAAQWQQSNLAQRFGDRYRHLPA